MYKSLLKSTLNTRRLRSSAFWRSDALVIVSEEDRLVLLHNGVDTILDMRTDEEISVQPSELAEDERFKYFNIPITAGAKVPESVEAVALSYFSMAEDIRVMGRIFTVLSDADEGVLFNCSAGKDRTGVVSAMLLMLAGAGREEIADNYVLTKEYSRSRLERVKISYPDIDMRIVIPDRRYILDFMDMLCLKYKTIENYLYDAGLSHEQIDMLKCKIK